MFQILKLTSKKDIKFGPTEHPIPYILKFRSRSVLILEIKLGGIYGDSQE